LEIKLNHNPSLYLASNPTPMSNWLNAVLDIIFLIYMNRYDFIKWFKNCDYFLNFLSGTIGWKFGRKYMVMLVSNYFMGSRIGGLNCRNFFYY
jgi:hypothetical protein